MAVDQLIADPATLLMTATVTPAGQIPGSRRNDPNLRLEEYVSAFRFYLSVPDALIDKIIILENSDFDLTIFHKILLQSGVKKEIVTINTSTHYDASKGKGYSEFKMIDAGIRQVLQSNFVSNSTRIWKVTGRLIVQNIDALILSAPPKYSFYCDLRRVPMIGDRFGGNNWMDLRIFSFSVSGYEKYLYERYDSGQVTEKAFFKVMTNGMSVDNYIFPRFRVQPCVVGYCGNNNKSYTDASYLFKNGIRQFCRQFLPGLWL